MLTKNRESVKMVRSFGERIISLLDPPKTLENKDISALTGIGNRTALLGYR